MLFNNPFPYNRSIKIHILIGSIIGILLGFILIVLQPFNINNLKHDFAEVMLMGFGIVKFINYVFAHSVANRFNALTQRWTVWNEAIFLIISSLTGAILAYLYLDLVFEKQPLSILRLARFFYDMVLPILPLILFQQLVLRYWFSKNGDATKQEVLSNSEKFSLKGQNAKDQLRFTKDELVYIKSMDNYIMVYLDNDQAKGMMLRATLSEILEQAPFLVQPHRSYLVNPKHAFKVKGNSQKAVLISDRIEETIPIARSSYKEVKNLFNSSL